MIGKDVIIGCGAKVLGGFAWEMEALLVQMQL